LRTGRFYKAGKYTDRVCLAGRPPDVQ